jgi:predicted Zn-dependent protease
MKSFLDEVRDHLESHMRAGVIEGFACTAQQKKVYSSTLINGGRHSKAPLHENSPYGLDVSLLLRERKGVTFTVEIPSMKMFTRQLEFAMTQAVYLEHPMNLRRQERYPSFQLASEQLLNINALEELSRLCAQTDSLASKIEHPRLMNREVSVSLAHCDKHYFDSAGNSAQELSASCTVSCAFALEDANEGHSDVFGVVPTDEELAAVVEQAARNIVRSKVHPLGSDAHLPVYLTHKAVIDLLDLLVVPNLDTRALIDKTGAWSLSQLGEIVVAGLTIEDQPHLEHSPFSSLFDFEGTPTCPVTILSQGRLVHPLMTSSLLEEIEQLHPEWQGRFGLTGHAVGSSTTSLTNVFFHLSAPLINDLSKHSYIQIQNLTGMSADPLTGQFALDADGAKVFKDGQLSFSTSLTLRGNFFEALVHKTTRVGPQGRSYNQWAPSLLTTALHCVSKELAQTYEGSIE